VSNRTTLAELREMTVDQAQALPVDHLAMLLEDVAYLKADAKWLDDVLNDALARRYSPAAADIRKAEGKDTGTVSITEDEFVIRADLPKKVEWDDDILANVETKLRDMGEDPTEYIVVKRTVKESAYNGWPSSLRSMFEPARTVSTGKPTFKVERAKAGRRAA